MSHINEKGEIELSIDDQDALRLKKNIDVSSLMNWIIWGNPEGFTTNFKINKHDKS